MGKFKQDFDAKIKQGYKANGNLLQISVFGADDISIDVLNLSVRADNALKRASIKTTTDIISRWNDLNKIRGLGVGTVREIKNSVLNYYYENMTDAQRETMWQKIVSR